jgi:hemolysin activation/secretion protein
VSYPLLRSQAMNLRLSAALQAKRLHDQRDATASSERKRSQSVPLSLSADRIDAGGVSWGSLALTFGRLRLDTALAAADAATAQTAGSFHKFNLEAARLQSLAPGWTLYGRLSGQWAGQNLDSSEKMVLGGPTGVRAWPSGEATGDEGLLAQLELRWRGGAFEPYAFIDGGRVRLNRDPWAAGDNRRSIAGAGLGVRWGQGPWLLDATVAWRSGDRAPATEPNAGEPQAWLSLAYRF